MNPTVTAKPFRLLIIDDNPAIHDDIRKVLAGPAEPKLAFADAKSRIFGRPAPAPRTVRFDIDSAFQGEEGLAKVREAARTGRPYALAFVDVRMPPGWDGIETTSQLWAVDKDLQVVLCTAYSDYSWEEILGKLPATDSLVILKKPFDNIEVSQMAYALTRKWQLTRQRELQMEELDRLVAERTGQLSSANELLKREIEQRTQAQEAVHQNLLEQHRLERQFVQAQKMEAVGQLAAGIAHDFNNLLQVIHGYSGMLLENEPVGEKGRRQLQRIIDTTAQAASLVRQLLTFSRKTSLDIQPMDIRRTFATLAEMLPRLLPENIGISLTTTPEIPLINADEALIQQVLLNLAVNARDAMPSGGFLTIDASEQERVNPEDDGNPDAQANFFLCLSVVDTGCGMAEDVLSRIFEPFFTTKGVGQGTGLGLSMVFGIAKQHGGWVKVESQPGAGTRFLIYLPACHHGPERRFALAAPVSALMGQETILVVEDEPDLRAFLVENLKAHGYRTFEAGSGPEALDRWAEHLGEIQLLFTDMVMPGGMTGQQLAERLLAEAPSLKVVCSSGYLAEGLEEGPVISQKYRYFLAKPFAPDKMLRMIRMCLDEDPWEYLPREDGPGK